MPTSKTLSHSSAVCKPFANFFIVRREPGVVELGLYAAEQERHNCWRALWLGPQHLEITDTLVPLVTSHVEDERGKTYYAISEGIVKPFVPRAETRIPGLDAATCLRLATKLGDGYVAALATEPNLLAQFRFGEAKREIILTAIATEAEARQADNPDTDVVRRRLLAAGTPAARARELSQLYDPTRSPYQYIIDGRQAFLTGDRFAKLSNGLTTDRLEAILCHSFGECAAVGHTRAEKPAVLEEAWRNFGIARDTADAACEALISVGRIKFVKGSRPDPRNPSRRQCVVGYAIAPLHDAECALTDVLATQDEFTLDPKFTSQICRAIETAADRLGKPNFTLDAEQAAAVRNVFTNRFSAITGAAGAGKTTVIQLVHFLAHFKGLTIGGVSLAGRAALNLSLSASIGNLKFEASTIHRALGLRSADETLEALRPGKCSAIMSADILIVDETAMIGVLEMAALLARSTARHIVFVGDPAQLPAISPGDFFRDILASGNVPVAHLSRNYRQDKAGLLRFLTALRQRRADVVEYIDGLGIEFVEAAKQDRAAVIAELYAQACDPDIAGGLAYDDVAVIAPIRAGETGVDRLNAAIRERLGFVDPVEVGDLLMVTKNQYGVDDVGTDIFNGERCAVADVSSETIDVEFPPDASGVTRCCTLLRREAGGLPDDVAYGYAMTAHKAQGSQWPLVIMPTAFGSPVTQNPHVYTAASRAKDRLIVVGSLDELRSSATRPAVARNTCLSLFLNETK